MPADTTAPPPTDEGLLPCPFCGERPDSVDCAENAILCSTPCCPAERLEVWGDDAAEAFRLWNTRTPDPAHDARIRADVLAEVGARLHGLLLPKNSELAHGYNVAMIGVFDELRAIAKPTEPRPAAGDAGEG